MNNYLRYIPTIDENPNNFILMHAMGTNTASQLGSAIAAGVLLAVVSKILGL